MISSAQNTSTPNNKGKKVVREPEEAVATIAETSEESSKETAVVTEVEAPAEVKTSTERGAKSKAKEVPADATITKPAARDRRGAKAVVEPVVEPGRMIQVEVCKTDANRYCKKFSNILTFTVEEQN